MTLRVCSELGCPTLTEAGSRGGRCLTHRREADQARGTRNERGYGHHHQAQRVAWQYRIQAGEPINCWRCGQPVTGDWHLGHADDRAVTNGPEHTHCNLSAAGKASHQ